LAPAKWPAAGSWFKRRAPALSFAVIFLVCCVALAVQTNTLTQLRREKTALRAQTENLAALQAENAEFQRLSLENGDLERLRKDRAELEKLRAEIAKLRNQLQEGDQLRTENQRLTATIAAAPAISANDDYFAREQAAAERIQCVNNLKTIGLAARIWAADNKDIYPSNFISMTNELGTWAILQCPSDKSRNVTSWADVAAGNVSYQMDASGIVGTEPEAVYVECPIHHNLLLVDGSVQEVSEKYMKEHVKLINGLKVYVP
jgi:hypothetical protein